MTDWRTSPAIIFLAVIGLVVVYYLARHIFGVLSTTFNELSNAFTEADAKLGLSNETVAGGLAISLINTGAALASILSNPTVLAALLAAGILTVLVWHEWE